MFTARELPIGVNAMPPTQSNAQHRRRPRHASGFTLVELTIVVLMLAILAALVIPKFSDGADESRTSATATTVKSVATMIQYHTNSPDNPTGDIPTNVDPDWFANNQLPTNPFQEDYAGPRILNDAAAAATQTHPTFKTIGANGVFWYNPSNGRFRALIPDQGSEAANLKLYNDVNASTLSAWDQTTGG